MDINHKKFNSWTKNANQTFKWFGADSFVNYNKNLAHHSADLSKYNWIDADIDYKINSHGFRCEEFNLNDSIMFLGCSLTFGIGLPLEKTFAYKVSQSLNLNCQNLSVGGASSNTSFRIAMTYIRELKPKIVVILFNFSSRFELLTCEKAIAFGPNFQNEKTWFYREWLDTPENSYLNEQKNIMAIHKLCDIHGCKFINLSELYCPVTDKARDLQHPGIQYHQFISDQLLQQL